MRIGKYKYKLSFSFYFFIMGLILFIFGIKLGLLIGLDIWNFIVAIIMTIAGFFMLANTWTAKRIKSKRRRRK